MKIVDSWTRIDRKWNKMLEFYSNKMLEKNNVSVLSFTNPHYGKLFYYIRDIHELDGSRCQQSSRTWNIPRKSKLQSQLVYILLCPQCHMISNQKVQMIDTSLVISNHSRKETTVGPPNFIHNRRVNTSLERPKYFTKKGKISGFRRQSWEMS